MNVAKPFSYLIAILCLGAVLRFLHLDAKPLWMDEVITAIFGFGRTYYDVPTQAALPLSEFVAVFQLNPAATCPQIAATVSTQSVHPPLFFCWMHQWLTWVNWLPMSSIWKLRAFPALLGVGAIAAVYWLNRVAFSFKAGLYGAAMMAVSPFAVYLSQEARHYTLPMLLVTLALVGLYQLLVDIQRQTLHPGVWLGWIAVNSLGFYVHYFFLLAFVAQVVPLLLMAGRFQFMDLAETPTYSESAWMPNPVKWGDLRKGFPKKLQRWLSPNLSSFKAFRMPLLAISAVCLVYLPWLPTFLGHMQRPETDWMQSHDSNWIQAIAPFYQIPIGWVLMVIAFPVEQQPLWIASLSVLLMLGFVTWLTWIVVSRLKTLWHLPETALGTQMLLIFVSTAILEFFAIAYLLGKDITQVPRYHFIYFPAICALLGVSLSNGHQPKSWQIPQSSNAEPLQKDNLDIQIFHAGLTPVQPLPRFKRSRSMVAAQYAVWIVLLVGLISSLFVSADLVFKKPYHPDQMAQIMMQGPEKPILVAFAYNDFQDMALSLSLANELNRQSTYAEQTPQIAFALMEEFNGYEPVWQNLATLAHPLRFPLNLWSVSPGLKRIGYRPTLVLRDTTGQPHQCFIDPTNYYRIGIPYQLYRCQ